MTMLNRISHSPHDNLKASVLEHRALLLLSLLRQKVIPVVFPASFPVQTTEGQDNSDRFYHGYIRAQNIHDASIYFIVIYMELNMS
jgi:hypothetical protein